MKLSTTTSVIDSKFGYEKAIEIIAKAGFDAVDLSLCKMGDENNVFNGDNYREYAEKLLKIAKDNGVYFNQAHAYFPTSFDDKEKNEKAFNKVVRGIEIAGIIGAKVIVVHPNQHLYYIEGDNDKILKEMNLEFYKRLLPYCEKYNVKMATENMFQWNGVSKVIIDSTCSRAPEFCEYVDMIESEYMTACLDIGHCVLVGQKPEFMIRALGHDRLLALHVHDNNGKTDNHVEPYSPCLSVVNWDEVCKALAEIDYKGDFTFEADSFFENVSSLTVDAAARYLHDIGRGLINKIESFK